MTISQLTLKLVLPLATTWAEQQEQLTLREGVPLTPQLLDDARRVGVAHPERVRLRQVDRVPMPVHPLLRTVGEKTGLISPHVAAMSLRYGLNIRSTEWGNRRIIVHELAHTAQYERLGGGA